MNQRDRSDNKSLPAWRKHDSKAPIMGGLFVGIFSQESGMQFLLALETIVKRMGSEIEVTMSKIYSGLHDLKTFLTKNEQFKDQEHYKQRHVQYVKAIAKALKTIYSWPQKTINEEAEKAQLQFPNIDNLYKTCYLSYLREIYANSDEQQSHNITLRIFVPRFSDFLFKFFCAILVEGDVVAEFVTTTGDLVQSMVVRKIFFMDCIRAVFSEYIAKTNVEKTLTPVVVADEESSIDSIEEDVIIDDQEEPLDVDIHDSVSQLGPQHHIPKSIPKTLQLPPAQPHLANTQVQKAPAQPQVSKQAADMTNPVSGPAQVLHVDDSGTDVTDMSTQDQEDTDVTDVGSTPMVYVAPADLVVDNDDDDDEIKTIIVPPLRRHHANHAPESVERGENISE